METIPVLSTLRFTEELLQQLQSVSPRLHLVQTTCHNSEEVAAALAVQPRVEVLYTYDLPGNVLDLAPDLRWIQLHSAGAEHVLDNPVAESGVAVTTVSGIHMSSRLLRVLQNIWVLNSILLLKLIYEPLVDQPLPITLRCPNPENQKQARFL